MDEKIQNIILNICHNGTHSAKIKDILIATGLSKLELWKQLQQAQFKWRISENLNGIKLLVIDEL